MGLITNKPGMSDKDTNRYLEISRLLLEKHQILDQLDPLEKEKRRKLQDEINSLLLEQIMLNQKITL